MKYLDFEINAQEYLKPTFSVMSVTEIFKIYSDTGTIFNQTSLNTHDNDTTIVSLDMGYDGTDMWGS